ncbi:amidohydrolase family protein [Streptomyces alkaliphilus]|uniref:Amidohydrolase family protein n=1 Tax=Streptomyces alkaliphilus TaxID=1472722 RepID=A0A7W3TCV6_9ACTN|nr:amidohydrolase [Streptomyces alkaliphilus]MBB0244447.1 amidohydrolase family protein [Streptomyces alkaliphilus]
MSRRTTPEEPGSPAPEPGAPPRTVLLRGGTVHTPADPFATAMVVRGDTVAWVGAEGAADSFTEIADEVVDLRGALVTPAFVDAHVHATATGLALTGLDLSGARDAEDLLRRVREHAHRLPADEVVLGHGWDTAGWSDPRPPGRDRLDEAAGGRPAYLTRVDVHSALVSTALVDRLPGVTGQPGFDADGPLTDAAHHAVRRAAHGSIGPTVRRAAQRAALRHAAELGIGGLHECAGPEISSVEDLTDLFRLAAEDPAPRVHGYWAEAVTEPDAAVAIRELGAAGAAGDLFVDGSLGSHTALLEAPYEDAPHRHGTAHLDVAAVADHVTACTLAGVQAGFHAIGDVAVATVLEGVRTAAGRVGVDRVRALRHRVEHAEMLTADTVAAFADLALTASVQPAFDAAWGGPDGMYATRLGRERAAGLNPFAALLRAGVPLALGSDAPVTPLDPWGALRAAAHHRNPAHRISVRAAFAAHTRGGWRALGRDDGGVLVPGAPADYAVWRVGELVVQAPDDRVARWSTDPRSATPGLPDLSPGEPSPVCLRTVVAGRVIHTAG